jgi:hypothetical protein
MNYPPAGNRGFSITPPSAPSDREVMRRERSQRAANAPRHCARHGELLRIRPRNRAIHGRLHSIGVAVASAVRRSKNRVRRGVAAVSRNAAPTGWRDRSMDWRTEARPARAAFVSTGRFPATSDLRFWSAPLLTLCGEGALQAGFPNSGIVTTMPRDPVRRAGRYDRHGWVTARKPKGASPAREPSNWLVLFWISYLILELGLLAYVIWG